MGCGSPSFTNVGFHNDFPRPVRVKLCRTDSCRSVSWSIGVDPGATASEQVRDDGRARRFVVVAPPGAVYGCLTFRFRSSHPDVTVPLSEAHGCGSGR